MSSSKCSVVLAALTTLGLASAAQAGTFYTVATIGQAMPGDSGQTFGTFYNNPGLATDGNDVVFVGAPNFNYGTNALYDYNIANQSLTLIALSSHTTSPDSSLFMNLGYPAVSNGTISFNAQTANNPSVGGIYTAATTGGSLRTLADTSTTIPGSSPSANFGTILNVSSMSGSTAVMTGGPAGNASSGIYLSTSGGALTKVLNDTSTAPSGGGQYGTFNSAAIAGSTIAYMSSYGNATGIYTASTDGSNAKFIVTANSSGGSSMPGGGNFGTIYGPVTDGSSVVIWGEAHGASSGGLFLYPVAGGTGTTIVSPAGITPIPGEPGAYFNGTTIAQGYAISNGIVAFNGESTASAYDGIYSYNVSTGIISPIIVAGNSLDGSTVTGAQLIGSGIANGIDEYAFIATLANGTEGIFVDPVTVPEPCTLGLIGMSGLLLLRRRRSRVA